MSDDNKYVIDCDNLVKIYKTEDIEVVALQGLDLQVEYGEMMAIVGNSGSGKSTLLNMIGALDRPSAGRLYVDGKDLFKLSENEMVQYKRSTVGFVWQNNARNLVPYLTAIENIELFMSITNTKSRSRAVELLGMVGMEHRRDNRLAELSGGEQQRIAIAIALCNDPKILLADEPTGSVDTRTSSYILDIFKMLNTTLHLTIVIVTHDRTVSKKVDRIVAIRDGRTSSEFIRKKAYAEELQAIQNNPFGDTREETHNELTVLDRAGRLQIPHEYLNAIGLEGKNKIKVTLEDGKIVLTPPENM